MILTLIAAVVLTGSEPSAADLAPKFVLVQQSLPGEQPNYEGWSKQQLETEWRRLDDLRPGLGGPIAMISIGAGIGAVDLVVFFFAGLITAFSNGRFDTGLVIGLSLFGVVAAGLLVAGVILMSSIKKERSDYTRQIEQVKTAIERLAPVPVAPPPNSPPPAMMPYPPQVMGPAPLIAVTLARF